MLLVVRCTQVAGESVEKYGPKIAARAYLIASDERFTVAGSASKVLLPRMTNNLKWIGRVGVSFFL